MIHVTPQGDTTEHVQEGVFCPCMPMVVDEVVRHNSYDGRETGEVCRLALDQLGMALADEGHEWTDQERDSFEHAVQVLDMHWPAKDSERKMEGRR
tara:strand:- start:61498 stop:61785 length:288 start_codon:yes stop_codon:yes gene_type:complete